MVIIIIMVNITTIKIYMAFHSRSVIMNLGMCSKRKTSFTFTTPTAFQTETVHPSVCPFLIPISAHLQNAQHERLAKQTRTLNNHEKKLGGHSSSSIDSHLTQHFHCSATMVLCTGYLISLTPAVSPLLTERWTWDLQRAQRS